MSGLCERIQTGWRRRGRGRNKERSCKASIKPTVLKPTVLYYLSVNARACNIKTYAPPSPSGKILRLHARSAKFESGKVFLRRQAIWLDCYEQELLTFPRQSIRRSGGFRYPSLWMISMLTLSGYVGEVGRIDCHSRSRAAIKTAPGGGAV